MMLPLDTSRLCELSDARMDDFDTNAEARVRGRTDASEQQKANYFISKSKGLTDQIDAVLTQHYDFTNGEQNVIINDDIRYRIVLQR